MFNNSEFCRVLEEPDKDGVTVLVINRGCSLHRYWQGGEGSPSFNLEEFQRAHFI